PKVGWPSPSRRAASAVPGRSGRRWTCPREMGEQISSSSARGRRGWWSRCRERRSGTSRDSWVSSRCRGGGSVGWEASPWGSHGTARRWSHYPSIGWLTRGGSALSDMSPEDEGIQLDDKFHDECGLFGVWNHVEAANVAYLGLYALQHRGQESAGIAATDGHAFHVEKAMGWV